MEDISHNRLYTTVARTQEVDVVSQLRMGVRLLQAQAHMCVRNVHVFRSISLSYVYTSYRNGKDLHFCHNSQFTNSKAVYYKRSPPFFPSLLLACVSSFIMLACALQLNSFFFVFFTSPGSLRWWKSQELLQKS